MKGISVIICCYNSESRIKKTLQHIKQQKLNIDYVYEIILVDNNCTDNTVNIAMYLFRDSPFKLHIIKEKKPGLIYARLAGIRASKFEYIVFCDDDNWLDQLYLSTVFDIFELNVHIGAVGGQSTIEVEESQDIPAWFRLEENAYAVGKQSIQTGDVTERLYLWGAGLAVRKNVIEKCFDENFPFLLTGRHGDRIVSGDDTEICNRIVLMGYRLYYDERLKYKHFISSSRLTDDYLFKLKKSFEASYPVLSLYSEFIRFFILSKESKFSIIKLIVFEKPFNRTKFFRMIYWLYDIPIYVKNDMKIIKSFYIKYGFKHI